MSCGLDIQAGLSLLFQRGLDLALRIQDDAMQAETPAERAKLATAFHRISRSVRQTAALKARLDRDARRALREDAQAARDDHGRRTDRHKGRIRARVQELIWSEHEGERAETLEDTLDELLDADALEDDFLQLPIEAQVQRLADDFRLTTPKPSPTDPSPPDPSPPTGEGVRRNPSDEGSMPPSTAAQPFHTADHPFSSG